MKRLLLAVLIAAFPFLKIFGQTFSNPVIMESMNNTGGSAGKYSTLLNVNGRPAITYYDSIHGNLMYVRAMDSIGMAWNTPVIADGNNDVGQHSSMSIINGFPAISYYDNTYKRLLYVRALDSNGTFWNTPMILDDTPGLIPGYYSSLTTVNGNPAIAYCEFQNMDLRFIRANDANGLSWNSPQSVATSNAMGTDAKLFIVNGNPAIACNEQVSGAVYFIRSTDNNGASWGPTYLVSGTGDVGVNMSCQIVSGTPAICYYDQPTSSLKFVRATNPNGSGWLIPVTLDNSGNVGKYPSMHIVNGTPAISYANSDNNSILYIKSNDVSGTNWGATIQATPTGSGNRYNSMILVNGNPSIAYASYSSNSRLHFIRAVDVNGLAWSSVYSFSHPRYSGPLLSMEIVQGKPAVVSVDYANKQIVYCRALDSMGATWGPSAVIQTVPYSECYPSLAVINGMPAISYYDYATSDLMYMRALDSVGASWALPRRVDSIGTVGNLCQLINLNERPAVMYFDAATSKIKFISGIDALGSNWNQSVYPSPAIQVHYYNRLSIIHGKPVITFVNNNNTAVYYVTALDSSGLLWSQTSLIDTGSGFQQSKPSVVEIDGVPFVTYGDPVSYTVVCRKANDSLGNTWGPIIYTSPTAFYGFDPEIVIVNGRPVISYLELERMMFVPANEPHGTTWGNEIFLDSITPTVTIPSSSILVFNGHAGIGYDVQREGYAYFTSACITPLEPQVAPTINICAGDTAILSALGYGTLSWYDAPTGGNYLGSGNTFTAGALSDTTTFYVQDSTCAAGARAAITVNVIPLPVINLLGGTTICNGWTIALNVVGTGYSWLWSTGNTSSNELFAPTVTTNYTVQATDINGCTSVLPFTITVIQPVTFNQTVTICENETFAVATSVYHTTGVYVDSTETQFGCDSIIITDLFVQPLIDTTVTYTSGMLTSSEVNAQYQWFDCTTLQNVNGATSQTFIPTQNGTYAAAIIAGPCSDTSECYTVTDVGVYDITSEAWNFVVAPNPSSGQITITTFGVQDDYVIEIVNTLGQVIAAITSNDSTEHILQIETPGVFLVKVRVNGSVKAQRIVVQ